MTPQLIRSRRLKAKSMRPTQFNRPARIKVLSENMKNHLACMSSENLNTLQNVAVSQSISSKEVAMEAFSINDTKQYDHFFLDYLEWVGFATACLNEINARGKA